MFIFGIVRIIVGGRIGRGGMVIGAEVGMTTHYKIRKRQEYRAMEVVAVLVPLKAIQAAAYRKEHQVQAIDYSSRLFVTRGATCMAWGPLP